MSEQNDISILEKINYPSDMKNLSIEELETLCSDLRNFIIDQLSNNPGHFGSSLGTVELTVALHYVYNTPYDRIVWDVGHQAYSHKILTGRKDRFHTNRQFGGLAGFPNPKESEYDAFIAGHASNSISAALGMAVASALKKEDRHVVAVIGDGSMTGGLAFEALNNANSQPNDILIILNDNDMAIDDNVGGIRDYLVKMTTSPAYNRVRNDVYQKFKKGNLITEKGKNFILRFNNSLKSLLTKQHNLFEGFNIRYFGPVDGHDLRGLVRILQNIKDLKGPKMLHIHTVKGKGFKPAEVSATVWHAPGKFDKETGERIVVKSKDQPQLFQDVFGHTLVELAQQDEKIVGITPAMPTGCSMTYMMKEFPDRAFDVGIAEAHAVTYSAGLAKEGLLPFCNIYSSFMQRAYDQVIHDVALQNLHMVMCLDRAGLVGEDGPTHHGAFDLAYMRCIPNLVIASPYNEHYLRHLMFTAAYGYDGPFVIRYPRGQGVLCDWECKMEKLEIGKGRKLKNGKDLAVLTIGPIGNAAREAIAVIEGEGYSIAHYDMIFLKPIDKALLKEVAENYENVMTIENGVENGGLGSAVLEYFSENNYHNINVTRVGLPDEFVTHGSIKELNKLCEIDAPGLAKRMHETLIRYNVVPQQHVDIYK
ncbi:MULTISPECIES: 1-deoxy-D-xylulose-5-phosphate synthase [Dysgonomonas]|uniref:1-deoxy-D-xylulose-5-phosphate synthase n=1 Tax=Dysgonomonas gadei ATCC BAA-286 TaxID=742766 RepID=F5J261_9BACT|nr:MULTISPECIES: 1-deoxy-D-xylulose-5-phosphate synthase [Dysgonomonas]EGK00317.1 1-deoxy-D-xylulose-5-phosphate synthase [Dysgonomonas gadei ATCC BAA-286]MBF0650514.1 1-deoxy-D-xylulose-5-phosphate synthase [Dysgonomonas sp. GY75]